MLEELSKSLPSMTAEFIKSQIGLLKKKKRGRRWSDHDKTLALSLFHASRHVYRVLSKMFILPSVSTLRSCMRKINIYPGLNFKIIHALFSKVKVMASGGELCSLVFDEISLREGVSYDEGKDEIEGLEDFGLFGKSKYVANHATVFMLKGLKFNWKQPIGYFLSCGPLNSHILHTILIDCLNHLCHIGFNVKAIIADQGPNNQKLFKQFLNVSEQQPFFIHENKKYFVFCDPPHLIKNIRNNLKRNGFKTQEGVVLWKYIVDFYNIDCKNSVRMAPKLTNRHINLPPFANLRVKYATQVLSHSVSAGIAYIAAINRDDSANATSLFINKFDMLFNCFNSRQLKSRQQMGHAFNDSHVSFFKKNIRVVRKCKALFS